MRETAVIKEESKESRTQKIIFLRFWVIDNKYHLVAFEGTTITPKRHLLGNNGLVQVNPPLDLVESFER